MTEVTLKLVKGLLQERMRKRLIEHPEQLQDALIDVVSLACINFRLKLGEGKDALLDALGQDLSVLDQFLEQITDELVTLIEDEEQEQEDQKEDPTQT